MSSGEKEVLGAATGAANRLSAEVLESAAPRAESALSASKLRAELTGREIAGGHAFEKHVLENGEFKGLEIRTREQFARHIESVVDRPDAIRELGAGRTAYYNDASSTVVIKNPKALDGGTAFQPRDARSYFERLR